VKEVELQLKGIYEDIVTINSYLETLVKKRFAEGVWSELEQDFKLVSPEFVAWFKNIKHGEISGCKDKSNLWIDIYEYLHSDVKDLSLKKIEEKLIEYTKEDKLPSGAGLLSDAIADGAIVRSVYLNGDKDLVALFGRLVPIPTAKLFSGRVPESIRQQENVAVATVQNIIEQHAGDIEKVESAAIKTQRAMRGKRRRQEMKILIPQTILERTEEKFSLTPEEVDTEIKDANTIYKPKCNHELANRLLEASKKIEPFTTVKHLAATKALPSILDDGLSGRKSLLNQYKVFRPASLYPYDRENGDADVICLGAFWVDTGCMQSNTAELVLDLDKLRSLQSEANNPCIFFKQKDLGFVLTKIRKVKIGDKEIFFTHTQPISECRRVAGVESLGGFTNIQFFPSVNSRSPSNYAVEPEFHMISSNFRDMNSILAMNFFRFLDGTCSSGSSCYIDRQFIDGIYDEFAKLDDKQLSDTLLNLTQKMCDTMEFNFYGSFLMNPALIKEINIYDKPGIKACQINMPEFVSSLQAGDMNKLVEVREKVPQLFQSYRFIDYLLPHVEKQPAVKDVLLDCRKNITLPLWRQRVEEGLLKNAGKERQLS
jgi:hypothetical protein